jgi:hypothetical protein
MGMPTLAADQCVDLTFTARYGDEEACWLNTDDGTIYAFIGPVAIVILVNLVLLVLVMRSIATLGFSHETRSQTKARKL